ncbi:MAG: S41 family peptidase [Phycisphaerales bacterium]|nr:S41 family peptidase [Phycisphaerales bacterium]
MGTRRNRARLALVLVALALAVVWVRVPMAGASRERVSAMLDPVVDVSLIVDRFFFREVDHEALQRGAIEGMLEALDDPYTQYIPATLVDEFDKVVRGHFVGIGAQVRTNEAGWLEIVSPLDDSPALLSGLQAGDEVVAVDGKSTWGETTQEVIDRLKGEPKTIVRCVIERADDAGAAPAWATESGAIEAPAEAPGVMPGHVRFAVEITRDTIDTPTVRGLHRDGGDWKYWVDPAERIAYVRVSQFTSETREQFPAVVRGLAKDGLRGLVLDLRANGGGQFQAAIEMVDLFLPGGLIVRTQGLHSEPWSVTASRKRTLPDFPMVVLVNGASASASEIVAGALADNGRAILLGERSFGKGVVQAVVPLPDDEGQLKITEAYYYLPSGRCIQREDDSTEWGVDPSAGFYVPMTNQEYRTMWRTRQQEEVLRPMRDPDEKQWEDSAWVLEHLQDKQLSAAVRAIRGHLDSGTWSAVSDEKQPVHAEELAALKLERQRIELLQRELLRSVRRMSALSSTEGGDAVEASDLLPDEAKLAGGELEVRDAEGKHVATLRITAQDLERWLMDAPLEREEEAQETAPAASASGDDAP